MDASALGWTTGLLIATGVLGAIFRARVTYRHRRQQRTRVEDALKSLYESEINGAATTIKSLAGAASLRGDDAAAVLQHLEEQRLIEMRGEQIHLTAGGRERGLNVLRAHRLWESFLAERTGFPETEWHRRAHDLEHGLSPTQVDHLSAHLQHPVFDPHGDPIPTAKGELSPPHGVALTEAPLERPLRIVHVEDEPEAVYAQIAAVGLYAGMVVRLLDVSPGRVRFAAAGREHTLPPLVAANVSIEPLEPESAVEPPSGEPLSALGVGECGRVLAISRRCRGAERRRLMDLGVLPGTLVRAEMRSPGGDPTAYRIRDALIALRAAEAELISVERLLERVGAGAANDRQGK